MSRGPYPFGCWCPMFRGMPDLNLGPNDYRKRDPRTGRWHLPDDPKLARNMLVVAIVILVFIFLHRDELSSGTAFGVTALFSSCAGIMFALWQKNRYW